MTSAEIDCSRPVCVVLSAVWDSSIVAAKYLEKLGPDALRGRRCLDLSAGCGLAGETRPPGPEQDISMGQHRTWPCACNAAA